MVGFTIFAIHATEAQKLADVTKQMRSMGAPKIECVDCGDHYIALEGSHRLAAAHALGLTPTLVIREQDETLDITAYDWYDATNWAETSYPAGDVAGELYAPAQAVAYQFGG